MWWPASVRVYLCLTPCDMRKNFDSLHALVRDHLRLDVFAGNLFAFANKRRNRINITGALTSAGLDFSSLAVTSVEQDRLMFAPGEALSAFLGSIGSSSTFSRDQHIAESMHPGMSDAGFRENRLRFSLQIGVGSGGGFVDTDLWNPMMGGVGALGHALEVAHN
ncbi:MAG: IS66 family insertion sequence element accessory protein TnpB [Bryobacteraceae bacterium]